MGDRSAAARSGHDVTVFEKADRIGGLLRYGIPDFKLEKHAIDRRVAQMESEGVTFRTGIDVGTDVSVDDLRARVPSRSVMRSTGSSSRATSTYPAASLRGIHFAMTLPRGQSQSRRGKTGESSSAHLSGRQACGDSRGR